MDVAMQALDLGGSPLDVVMRAHGSPEFSESSPGAAAHVASADLTATEVIDLGIQRVEVTATFSPGTVATTSPWPVGATGAAGAVAAGYAVYASARLGRESAGEGRRGSVRVEYGW